MKKIISMVLAFILVFCLCGCTIDVNCNCNCGCKEKTEMKVEEPVNNIESANDINQVEVTNENLPGPVSIPTQTQYNWQNIKADPDPWLGFDRDPYLG